MHRLIMGPIVLLLIHLAGVDHDRLEAIWIGPDGDGGEGNWNVPSNWNLRVVPINGADGNGDGLPDIFDVRIDGRPESASLVDDSEAEVEVAGLALDTGDIFELTQPFPFTLHNPSGTVGVVNDGLIRFGESEFGSIWHSAAIRYGYPAMGFSS